MRVLGMRATCGGRLGSGAIALAALLLVGLDDGVGLAAFPGTNGKIAFVSILAVPSGARIALWQSKV